MNKESKAKWVAGLRSGEFKQGVCFLNNDDKHCCMGVLCETERLEKIYSDRNYAKFIQYKYKDTFSFGRIPTLLREDLGIEYPDESHLISMNDSGGRSFLEIADWIEENL